MYIGVSLLSADFSRLGVEVERLEKAGTDALHWDIMDGHFVPNLSIGPSVLQALRSQTSLPFDVHLMVQPVEHFLPFFLNIGVQSITIHPEACQNPRQVVQTLLQYKCRVGIAINPFQRAEDIDEKLWENSHQALLMTVKPGMGGQSFLPEGLRSARFLKDHFPHLSLHVDGGITGETIHLAIAAGVHGVVSGSFVLNSPDYAAAIQSLRATPKHAPDSFSCGM